MERADLEQWRPKDVARLLALVEGQRRYFQEIVAVLPVGILVLSADLEVMLANAAVRKILSLPEQGPLRLRMDAVLPQSALDRVRQVMKTRTAEANIVVEAVAGRRLQIGITVIPAWDEEGGREVLLTIQELGAVAADSAAVPLGSVPVRRSAAADLTADLPDHLAAVLWAVEPRTMRPIFVSPQAQQLLGFAGTFWINNPSFWSDRVHPGDRERVMQFYQRVLKSAGD